MIDRIALASLSPAKRAQLIYSDAQAEMSRRLWQAALGGGGDDARRSSPLDSRARGGDTLDTLLAELTRGVAERGALTDRSPTATSEPTNAAITSAAPPVAPRLPLTMTTASAPAAAGNARVNGLGPNAHYAATLTAAAERVGVAAPALAAIVDAEAGKASDGSWKIYSRNPRSSAAGIGQFLNRTWEGLAETRGTWLHDFATHQGWLGADGHVRPESRAAVLATRYDPTAAINGIADYARRNLDGLRRAGVATEGEVGATARLAYLSHHLGLGDAVRFLRGHGLGEGRARVLLDAQIGVSNSARRIAAAGDATSAHRDWLLAYLDRNIRPIKFTAQSNA